MSFLWVHAECGYQRKTSWSYLSERIRKDKQPTAGLETYLTPLSVTVGVAQTEWSSHKRSKEYRSWFSLWLRRTFVGFDEQFNLQKELSSRNSATTEKRKTIIDDLFTCCPQVELSVWELNGCYWYDLLERIQPPESSHWYQWICDCYTKTT